MKNTPTVRRNTEPEIEQKQSPRLWQYAKCRGFLFRLKPAYYSAAFIASCIADS